MEVKFKKLRDDAVIPAKAHDHDAGFDLTATSKEYDEHGNVVYGTSLAFAIPKNHVGYLFPRSSNAKKDLILSNSVGVIDSGYRGEVMFKFKLTCGHLDNDCTSDYHLGDRVGQLIIMPIPEIEFIEVGDLGTSDRGTGGFGSSDPITKSIEDNCQ